VVDTEDLNSIWFDMWVFNMQGSCVRKKICNNMYIRIWRGVDICLLRPVSVRVNEDGVCLGVCFSS
jgi:hypothetical protein